MADPDPSNPSEPPALAQSPSAQDAEVTAPSRDTATTPKPTHGVLSDARTKAGRGRCCPGCGVSLHGRGTLTACPECRLAFIEPTATGTSHLAQGLRIVGPWVALGGVLAVWRLDKLGSNRVLESIDWFYFALIALGIGMWAIGKWMGISERK